MICPMKFNCNSEVEKSGYDCEKEECAWWDHHHEQCEIKSIRQALGVIAVPPMGEMPENLPF